MLKIIFMGTPSFSVPILDALNKNYEVTAVVTQPDKEVGRHRELQASPVKEYALRNNIKVYQPVHIKESYEELIELNADLIVTAAYGQFVGTKLLNAPRLRAINCHASLLPKYRGGAPIHEAIKNGEEYTGISIMYMEKKMDAGDVLLQEKIKIEEDDDCGTMFNKLSLLGASSVLKVIPLLEKGLINRVKQDESLVSFAYNITKEQCLLDFSKPALSVYNHIRAYHPSPVCYMELKNEQIKVYKACLTNIKSSKEPGSLVLDYKNRLLVVCGDSYCIEILSLQEPSKKQIDAKSFINGSLRKYL